MVASAETQSLVNQYENLTLRITEIRALTKQLRDDFDFPHNLERKRSDLCREIEEQQKLLAALNIDLSAVNTRLDRAACQKRYDDLCTDLEALVAERLKIRETLAAQQSLDKAAPALSKLEKLAADLQALPEDQLKAILTNLLPKA